MAKEEDKYIIGGNRGLLYPGPDDLAKLEQIESSTRSATRKDKFRRHCRRFWLCYFIGNVIFLAIFLPVFFLVAIPAIAQLVVNKSNLVVVNAEVMQPTPDTVQMTLAAKVDLKIALGVRIEPVKFYTFVRKYGHENAWGAIDIPGQTIKGNYTLGVNKQHTPILNSTTWQAFVHDTVFKKETTLSLYGVTYGYLGVLKNHITMDKEVVIPSLNKFDGLSIADSTLILPAQDDGTNLIANLTLPNPTALSFEVGTITLDLKSGDTDLIIGNATVDNVTLRPGNNTFPLKGVLDLKTVISNLTEVISSQSSSLKNGNLALTAMTRTIVSNGTLIPYYTNVLSQLPLVANVGIADVLRNTLAYLGSNDNLNLTGALSGITDNIRRRALNGPVGNGNAVNRIASLKQNKHVQKVFEDEDDDKRDAMIDSLARYYASL
ncbi:uncharacterized protein N7446_008879 [Penicillium canescens]|uniref:Uncharacterized protein n=1 Tax=Penicillium canescens TaxID=5083 RepID=A0AAD6IQ14_PENCN|nr:uncharacterized protein N7446_008879 [Penicillium canescens]KAJ6032827.1 hypothetical protein N7444_010598 [Penicillium canescens]KAJ6057981.1 hypothetical protein N7460_001255 [Penicillium canescens]KAJ6059296.1 hypothetical protein N7446_008879 [Penicillium canescens]